MQSFDGYPNQSPFNGLYQSIPAYTYTSTCNCAFKDGQILELRNRIIQLEAELKEKAKA